MSRIGSNKLSSKTCKPRAADCCTSQGAKDVQAVKIAIIAERFYKRCPKSGLVPTTWWSRDPHVTRVKCPRQAQRLRKSIMPRSSVAACSGPAPLAPALNHERSLTPLAAPAPAMGRGGERVEKEGIEREIQGGRERKRGRKGGGGSRQVYGRKVERRKRNTHTQVPNHTQTDDSMPVPPPNT